MSSASTRYRLAEPWQCARYCRRFEAATDDGANLKLKLIGIYHTPRKGECHEKRNQEFKSLCVDWSFDVFTRCPWRSERKPGLQDVATGKITGNHLLRGPFDWMRDNSIERSTATSGHLHSLELRLIVREDGSRFQYFQGLGMSIDELPTIAGENPQGIKNAVSQGRLP